jgi:hypothetical protein
VRDRLPVASLAAGRSPRRGIRPTPVWPSTPRPCRAGPVGVAAESGPRSETRNGPRPPSRPMPARSGPGDAVGPTRRPSGHGLRTRTERAGLARAGAVFSGRLLQTPVDRPGKSELARVGDNRDRHARGVPDAGLVSGRVVGRPVVDDDQLSGRPCVPEQRLDAKLGGSPLIPARDDNRCHRSGYESGSRAGALA